MRAVLTILIAASACAPDYSLPPPRVASAPAGNLHDEAVRELAAATSTEYQHVIRIDEPKGVFEYDCSGFVDYALSNVAPAALDALRRVHRVQRPNARAYVELLANIPARASFGRWLHVGEVSELAPGDVVAWLAPVKKADAWGIVNTGHVMIVDGSARERSPGEWGVPIIDSSFGHGGADRRAYPGWTGLGRGTIVLVVENDAVVGYRWRETAPIVHTRIELGRVR